MEIAFVGLGSNLHEPIQQIQCALNRLKSLPNTHLLKSSSLYETKPVGPQNQPNYINAVAMLETELSPLALLKSLQSIENQQGRIRGKEQWGPRTLDLDLLIYGKKTLNSSELTLPHPRLMQRAFVLVPFAEIAGTWVIFGKSAVSDILKKVDTSTVSLLK